MNWKWKFSIINLPIYRRNDNKVYGFGSDEIYQEIYYGKIFHSSRFFKAWQEALPDYITTIGSNNRFWRYFYEIIRTQLIPNQSSLKDFEISIQKLYEDYLKRCSTQKEKNARYQQLQQIKSGDFTLLNVDNYILKIEIDIRRQPENYKTNTFDTIELSVGVHSDWPKEVHRYFLKNHKEEFLEKCLELMEKRKKFNKFGIPINFLKVSEFIYRPSINMVTILLELKDIENS